MSSLETYIAKNKGYCGMVPTTAEECEPVFLDVQEQLNSETLQLTSEVFLMNVWRDLEIICGGAQREIYR